MKTSKDLKRGIKSSRKRKRIYRGEWGLKAPYYDALQAPIRRLLIKEV